MSKTVPKHPNMLQKGYSRPKTPTYGGFADVFTPSYTLTCLPYESEKVQKSKKSGKSKCVQNSPKPPKYALKRLFEAQNIHIRRFCSPSACSTVSANGLSGVKMWTLTAKNSVSELTFPDSCRYPKASNSSWLKLWSPQKGAYSKGNGTSFGL